MARTQTILALVSAVFLTCNSAAEIKVRPEIAKYKDVADRIIQYVMNGPGQNETYNRLAYLTDTFGSRHTGDKGLEEAIDYAISDMTKEKFDNVHGETDSFSRWKRGIETAELLTPRRLQMSIMGIGYTIPTPPDGITAEALVVENFDELRQQAAKNKTKGKIIVYNQKWVSYGYTGRYRTRGAVEAAKVGGVAALVRSVTPRSIYSPHTGGQVYDENVPKIPSACITVEDAEMLHRFSKRGLQLTIRFYMNSTELPQVNSRNTIAEITGTKYPHQKVVFGGHMDSWDVGDGAMDDGGGVLITWQAMRIMKALNLRPKRTVRAVFWTAEEIGLQGAVKYYARHKDEAGNTSLIMESDMGTFTPYGIGFTGNEDATRIMTEILQFMKPVNASTLAPGGRGPDTGLWLADGVPGGNLRNYNDRYFDYHHTRGDSMTMQDPKALDLCTILWAYVTYVVADLEDMLPRGEPATTVVSESHQLTSYSLLIIICLYLIKYTISRH